MIDTSSIQGIPAIFLRNSSSRNISSKTKHVFRFRADPTLNLQGLIWRFAVTSVATVLVARFQFSAFWTHLFQTGCRFLCGAS